MRSRSGRWAESKGSRYVNSLGGDPLTIVRSSHTSNTGELTILRVCFLILRTRTRGPHGREKKTL